MSIHEKIKARRLELGLTLEDVARALNVSKSTILRYETNEIENMGIDKIEMLAKVLQVAPGYLMGWHDKPIPDTPEQAAQMVDKEGRELAELINRLDPAGRAWALEMLRRLSHNE